MNIKRIKKCILVFNIKFFEVKLHEDGFWLSEDFHCDSY